MPVSDISAMGASTRIGLLLIDGFALMSYASFIEPFRAANSLAAAPLYEWVHVSLSEREVAASNGARLIADVHVGEALDCDMLLLFAAGDPAEFGDDACFAWLRALARRGVPIGGVSGGPYLLARAGILTGYRATIHWEHALALQAEFPTLELEEALYVIDRDRMTCAGGTAGLDLALSLIEQKHGPALASRVAEWFIRAEPRRANDLQRADLATRHGTLNSRLLLMLAAMERAIEDPLPLEELAGAVGISLRHLERLSSAHLGKSIAEAYCGIRLERAMELLRSTGMTVTEVSMATGFCSPAHFSRRFRARFGISPASIG